MNLRWYVDEVNQAEPVLQVWKELAGEWVTVPTVTMTDGVVPHPGDEVVDPHRPDWIVIDEISDFNSDQIQPGKIESIKSALPRRLGDEVVAFDPPPAGEHEWLVDELKPETGDG